MDPRASVSIDPTASNSIDKDVHAATNVAPSVSDYVDGKICLICDFEFQSPILAIKHAQINHLDVIDTGSSESKVAKIDEFEDNFDFNLDDEQIDNDNSASSVSSTPGSKTVIFIHGIQQLIPNFCFISWQVPCSQSKSPSFLQHMIKKGIMA